MKRITAIVCMLFFVTSYLSAQSFKPSAEQTELVKKAGTYFDKGSWLKAIATYEKAIDLNSGTTSLDGASMAEATWRIARSYEKLGDRNKTAVWYEKAKGYNPQNRELIFTYGRSLQAAGRDADALKAFDEYIQKGGDMAKARSFQEVITRRSTGNYQTKGSEVKKVKLREDLSASSPVFLGNDLVFVSPAKKELRPEKTSNCKAYKTNLYKAKQKMNGEFAYAEVFCVCLNSKKYDESAATFNREFSVIYFTRNEEVTDKDGKKVNRLAIFQLDLACNKNVPAKRLSFVTGNSNFAFPAINKEGTAMYFASDMPGGQGGMDIYVVSMTDSTFGKPENLGKIINTANDEISPYVASDGKFYFSSNGHAGLGGFDLFSAELDASSQVVRTSNLKEPVNSAFDETGFAVHPQMGTYFGSNRAGKWHVYKLNASAINLQTVEIKVADSQTSKEITDAKVELLNNASKKGNIAFTATDGKVVFEDVLPGNYGISVQKQGYAAFTKTVDVQSGKSFVQEAKLNAEKQLSGIVKNTETQNPVTNAAVIWTKNNSQNGIAALTDNNGKYTLENIGVEGNVIVKASGFSDFISPQSTVASNSGNVSIKPSTPAPAKVDNLAGLNMSPIVFPFAKAIIKQDEFSRLKKIGEFLKNNPNAKVVLTGCTDDKGKDSTNAIIAQRRADAVKKFLLKSGASEAAVSTKVAIKIPVDATCKKEDKACIEKSRKQNRRVEIKINQ